METPMSEDEAIEMAMREFELKPLIKDDCSSVITPCIYCPSLSVDEKLLQHFGISICFNCKKDRKEEYRFISKSKAQKEYLLNDQQISKLKSMLIANPRKIGWNDMKLYLLSQVKKEAMRIWGSLENIAEEKKLRSERLLAQVSNGKIKKKKKSLFDGPESSKTNLDGNNILETEVKRQRISASLISSNSVSEKSRSTIASSVPTLTLPDVFVKSHVHKYGPSKYTGNDDEYEKSCVECGFKLVYQTF